MTTSPHSAQSLAYSCPETTARLRPVQAGVFYTPGACGNPARFSLYQVEAAMHYTYITCFHCLDPLLACHFEQWLTSIATFASLALCLHEHYPQSFLQPWEVQDVAEIFVRHPQRIIGAISLLRAAPFSATEIHRLQAVIPLLTTACCNLLTQPAGTRLTAREYQVVDLVCMVTSNQHIVRKLNISLSTVKTHLRNIFSKTQVSNCTELVTRRWA